MTSGVKSGLKSWLTFGSSVAGSQGGMARSKSVAAESEMEADPIHSGIFEAVFFAFFWYSVFFDTFGNLLATFVLNLPDKKFGILCYLHNFPILLNQGKCNSKSC